MSHGLRRAIRSLAKRFDRRVEPPRATASPAVRLTPAVRRERYALAIRARFQLMPKANEYHLADSVLAVRDHELAALRSQIARARRVAAEMRDGRPPDHIAVVYADRLDAALDGPYLPEDGS
jgi:hypothetical protein